MKKTFLLCTIFLSFLSARSQTTIASYSFESNPASVGGLTPGSTPTFVSGNSGASDGVASSAFTTDGDSAWSTTNSSANILFSNISLTGFTNCFVQFRLGSWSIGGTTNGADPADSIHVLISTDGGSTWSSELKINGPSANNAYWNYAASGSAIDTFDADNTPTIFTPGGGGNRSSDGFSTVRISIPNAYTQVRLRICTRNNTTSERWTIDQLEIKGTTSGSSNSKIITSGNETSNIAYQSKTGSSITTTSDAIRVWSFTIQDGGGTADADALSTVLNSVTIDKGTNNGVSSWASTIKQAALFDGSTKVAEVSVTAESIAFTGLTGTNVTAADDGNKTLDLYLTFETTAITDNQQYQFRITSGNVTSTGSQFATFSDTSSIISDKNRIEVTATKLNYIQQPSNTVFGNNMSPAVTVEAADANNQRDLDFVGQIRITSTGNLNGTPIDVTASNGLATFSSLQHSTVASSLTMNAERTSTLDWDITSNTFNITGNAQSDIINSYGFGYTNNIDYTLYQASTITNTSHSIGVYKFTIRDGGASADADNLPTILNNITFSSVAGIANIKSAALFNANAMVNNAPIINTAGGTIAFTGVAYSCSDDATRDLTLRVTFESSPDSITDNQQMVFTIASANVSASSSGSSQFTSFTSISSTTSGDSNKIEVNAKMISFGTQPSSGSTGSNLPAFTVRATDSLGALDLDHSNSIALSSNGSGMTSSSPYSLTSGVANITGVQFSVAQNNIYIIATASGLSNDNDDTSANFNISSVAANSYRTAGGGTWPSSGTASWERFVSGSWSSASAPAAGVTDSIYIRHALSTNAAWGSTSSAFVIQSGGSLTVNQNGTLNYCRVENGGSLSVLDAGFAFTTSTPKNFILQNGATMNLNTNGLDNGDNFWQGNEDFQSGSTIVIQDWNFGAAGGLKRLVANPSQISANSSGNNYLMGNLSITASPTAIFGMVDGSQTIKLCENDFTSNTSGGSNVTFTTSASNVEIGGSLIVNANQFSVAATTSGAPVTTINGKIRINNAAVLDINQNSSASATSFITLKGNLEIYNTGNIKSTDGGCGIDFGGNALQQIDFASSAGTISDNVDYNIKNGANVILVNNNWKVGNGTDIIVESGGTLNFGYTGLTPLNITESGGTTSFTLNGGGKIKITSADGIDKDGAQNVGNVRLDTRTYSSTATYHYIGKSPSQRIGDGVSVASSGKTIIIELDSLNTAFLYEGFNGTSNISTGNIALSSSGVVNIIQGTITATNAADFTGTGDLQMSGGLYKTNVDSATSIVPQLSGTYTITGGSIELNGSNINQRLRGGKTYYNLVMSGANTFGSNRKSNTSSITVNNNLYITASAIFCAENNGVSGAGGLTMDGGRFQISKVTGTLPELTATASGQSYNLTGGTIQLYNTTSTQQQTLRARDGNSNTITYFNIDLNALNANTTDANINPNNNFNVSGAMSVYGPCVLRLDANDIVGGSGNFSLNNGATLWYSNSNGITTSGGNGQITLSGSRSFSKLAGYGFIGSGNMSAGNAMPDSVSVLYINKSSASNLVTLLQNTTVADSVAFRTGIVSASASPVITFSDNATATSMSDNSFVDGLVQKAGNDAFIFPIGKIGTGHQAIAISAPDHISDLFAGQYFRGNPRNTFAGSLASGLNHITSCEYWQLNEINDAGSATSINVTLYFNNNSGCDTSLSSSYITDVSKLRVLHYNGSSWDNYGNASTSGNDDIGSITVNNISSFSPFSFGSTQAAPINPLPVHWLNIYGIANINSNHIIWQTACENNIAQFDLEMNNDFNEWKTIETIMPVNNQGCITTQYEVDDITASQDDRRYYRVKEIPLTGSASYSPIIFIDRGKNKNEAEVTVFNTLNSSGNIQLKITSTDAPVTLQLYNQQGQNIYSKSTQAGDTAVQIQHLASGIYLLKTTCAGKVQTQKVIVL